MIKNEIGVTVIRHESENRTLVDGYEPTESILISQLVSLINVSLHCEQFIKYEFRGSTLEDGFWVSHDSIEMTFWSGAPPEYQVEVTLKLEFVLTRLGVLWPLLLIHNT